MEITREEIVDKMREIVGSDNVVTDKEVLEDATHGIPSLAVSLEVEEEIIYSRAYADVDFRSAEEITRYWIEWALCKGMPSDCDILNINVPSGRTGVLDYRFTRLERSNYYQLLKPGKRDFAKPFRFQSETLKKPESDRANGDIFTVLRDRLTSVTPLSWDMARPSAVAPIRNISGRISSQRAVRTAAELFTS